MRFTPAKLHALVERLIAERRREVSLLAAYLCGSLAENDPFLGQGADVDVVLIHNATPSTPREILVVHEAITVEIFHHDRVHYEPPRRLRTDPLWGATLFYARSLYDPQHFLDFVQAAVRSRFHDPEVAWTRARAALDAAREAWRALSDADDTLLLGEALLACVGHGLQVAAALAGQWLPPRRRVERFAALAERLGHPDWLAEVLGLLGVAGKPDALHEALATATRLTPADAIAQARWRYYLQAAQTYAEGATPAYAWAPLLWGAWEVRPAEDFLNGLATTLGWTDPEALSRALDGWLDALEVYLDLWGARRGLGPG